MSKKIEFEYEDKKYVLEYNRDAVKVIENQGFDINKFTDKPMTMIDLAFKGSFIKNHRNEKNAKVEEIYANMGDKESLAKTLLEMIQETYDTLFEEQEDKAKNIGWKIV